mmetsp:Transcript_23225/g.71421  ORF Transcript_23225/g.71421 Transcript_23225/m.71421 type:complete len:327 (-) Transcript_23225:1123-2103(-)
MRTAVLFCRLLVCAAAAAAETCSYGSLGEPTEFVTSSARKGYRLAVRRWTPPTTLPTRASVVLQHGGGWHSGYFEQLGAALAAKGFAVVALDEVGHGFSEGPGGRTLWAGLAVAREDLRRIVGNQTKPVVLLAESAGTTIAIPLAFDDDSPIDALVVSGGLFGLAPQTAPPKVVLAILSLLGRVLPFVKVTLPSLNATFDEAFGDARWAAAAREDPNVVVDSFYLGQLHATLREAARIRTLAHRIHCPLLIMHSRVDARTDPDAAVTFFNDATNADAGSDLLLYDDASHQLFQDDDFNTRRAIKDLLAWLDDRFPSTTAEEDGGSS